MVRPLQLCEDQGIREKLEKPVCNYVLAILTTYMRPGFKGGFPLIAEIIAAML